ncbi:MAG: sensor histidine kinase [Deltaproteobacteria bacterium]|nr:sensor histidine kinase [Deltaproteobacteria bacterium]
MGDRPGTAQRLLEDLRPLFTRGMLVAAWLPCLAITALHYRIGPEHAWVHDVLRRLYYLPILLAAFSGGSRGGVAVSVFASLVYLPHAFTRLLGHDPGDALEKGLEIVLYNIVAVAAGLLVDRERREREKQERLARRLGEALSEQQRTEAQLIRAGRLGALGELTAGIAHEIKNPLHGLKGTAEILRDAIPESAPERRMLELHISEIDRLGNTADRFLSFARPVAADRRPVDPRALVERVASLISAQARKEGVETAVEPPVPGVLPRVTGDPELLAQLLLNIALNGVQSMAPAGGGRMTFGIRAEREGGKDFVRFRVANDGPPIPEERLEKIFDPFFTTRDGGTGLGLSICSRIADQHEGILEVRNLPGGEGVEFMLTLAAQEERR